MEAEENTPQKTESGSSSQKQISQGFKRHIAYKLRIGPILSGKQILDLDRLKALEINSQEVSRINLIANITEKYIQDGEKKYGSITLDDGTGQIKAKVFGEDIEKLSSLNEGSTVLIIGLLKQWNNEVYITPEIIKKKTPQFLLLRKLEVEAETPKQIDRTKLLELKDKILQSIKEAEKTEGIEIDKIIMNLKEPAGIINEEIRRLIEEGLIYEPRPGKLRYLG